MTRGEGVADVAKQHLWDGSLVGHGWRWLYEREESLRGHRFLVWTRRDGVRGDEVRRTDPLSAAGAHVSVRTPPPSREHAETVSLASDADRWRMPRSRVGTDPKPDTRDGTTRRELNLGTGPLIDDFHSLAVWSSCGVTSGAGVTIAVPAGSSRYPIKG